MCCEKMGLKEICAWYDPNTGKIRNAKEGSLVYFHELRHKQQFNNKFMKVIFFMEIFLIRVLGTCFLLMAFLLDRSNFSLWVFSAGIMLIPTAIVSIGIEVDAWIYAIIKKFA